MSVQIPDSDDRACASSESPVSFEDVYERLKGMAHRHLSGNGRDTLDTTALVHELYLRMDGGNALKFEHPSQFFAYAARAMRHLLLNRVRDRMRQKAGGEWARISLANIDDAALMVANSEQAFALEEALAQLEASDPRAEQVFELRYFAGLSPEQISKMLGQTRRTTDRDWRYARAFLVAALT